MDIGLHDFDILNRVCLLTGSRSYISGLTYYKIEHNLRIIDTACGMTVSCYIWFHKMVQF
jgi:hypothetical protein